MRKDINDNVISSYFIQKYDSGIISLIINTVDRWVNYHRYNDNEYLFTYDDSDDNEKSYILKIDESELEIPLNYLPTVIQEKDQISFYWLPVEMITNNSKIKNKLSIKRLNKIKDDLQEMLDEDNDNYQLKTDDQLIEDISNFGCGEINFHTADIERLLKEKQYLLELNKLK